MKKFGWRTILLVSLGVGAVAMAQNMAQPQARQMERQVLVLHCADTTGPICQALFQALASEAPRHIIRMNPETPVPGAISVTLELNEAAGALAGSLSWQVGPGPIQHGPDYVSDAVPDKNGRVSHAIAREFAEGVVQITPKLRDTLNLRSKP